MSIWTLKGSEHPWFRFVASAPTHALTRRMVDESLSRLIDVDGNFLEQLRGDGFDSRVWELYLNETFLSMGFHADRSAPRPDWILVKRDVRIAVEAVVAARNTVSPSRGENQKPPALREAAESYLRNDVAIALASPLWRKLKEQYWKEPRSRGSAVVIALAPFFKEYEPVSDVGLMSLLYGVSHEGVVQDEELVITPSRIEQHSVGSKTIRSNMFGHAWMRHVSAVIYSNAGTIAKFQRMAARAWRREAPAIYHFGYCYKHDPTAAFPERFFRDLRRIQVRPEAWATGLSVLHNPHALIPLPDDAFPGAAHHHLRSDGLIESSIPSFHPISSRTLTLGGDGSPAQKERGARDAFEEMFPREAVYQQLFWGE